jgi:hypothetical protein
MRCLLISVAVLVGVVWGGLVPAMANPLTVPGVKSRNVQATLVERVGYWRRQYRYYRRYGYPVPYAYYPPVGYYAPPPAYAYYSTCVWLLSARERRLRRLSTCEWRQPFRKWRLRMATTATIRRRMATNYPQPA